MLALFDGGWNELELEHVRAFVASAGEEGLLWEAKSDGALSGKARSLHPDSVGKAACAFANQLGGYIIIGAERQSKGGPWELPGSKIPGDEPELWIGQAMRSLTPVPQHDIKLWPASEKSDRWVGVVEVQPLLRTPCLTRDGRVFERVSGASLPVTNPARLRELIQRGEQARDRAETNLRQRLARATPSHTAQQSAPGVHVALGLVATSYPPPTPTAPVYNRIQPAP